MTPAPRRAAGALALAALLALVPLPAGRAAPAVPAPEAVLGFVPGDEGRLADWTEILAYLRALDAASDRVSVEEVGKTTQGRPFVIVTVTSEANHARLEQIRLDNARLADPRGLPDAEAARLVENGRAVVAMAFSIHSIEVGGTLASLRLLHRLASAEDAETRAMLDEAVLLVLPSHNPDGTQIVAEWQRRQRGTPFEKSPPPVLYHPYVGHDNNRDWYAFTQQETRLTVEHLYHRWHPQVVHDVHQMGTRGARVFVPPYEDPWEPNVDPALVGAANALGAHVASSLLTAGRSGVVTGALFDAWTPGRAYPHTHGGVRLLSETASARLASPIEIRPDELDGPGAEVDARRASASFPRPWPGGIWSLRDVVDTQIEASLAVLSDVAAHRRHWLRTALEVNRRACARTEPFAFVAPAAFRDPAAAQRLADTLRTGEVEVRRATAPFSAGGREYAAGSLVVFLQQPASAFAKTVLERQRYPDLRDAKGAPRRPYDVTAHTLPLLLGVEVDTIPAPFEAATEPLPPGPLVPGGVEGHGPRYALGHTSGGLAVLGRLVAAGVRVHWAAEAFEDGGRAYPPGALLVPGSRREALAAALQGTGIVARAVHANPRGRRVRAPRVGLYRSWVPSMDEGWTRFVFEKLGLPFQELRDREVRAGRLRTRFDAIVLPAQSASALRNGQAQGAMPDEYTGGLGDEGVAALRAFVAAGGTLVALDSASRFAIDALDLPVRDVGAALAADELVCPGSILRATRKAPHPLADGLPDEVPVWFEGSPVLEPGPGATAVLGFDSAEPLLSGYLLGGARLAGRSALVEVRQGQGRVVLFGFRPQYRAQSQVTYPALLNALYLAAAAP